MDQAEQMMAIGRARQDAVLYTVIISPLDLNAPLKAIRQKQENSDFTVSFHCI